MIKIIVTISDFGAAMHIGGDVIRFSHIIDVPTKNIPIKLKEYFKDKDMQKYSTISLSILKEDIIDD